MTASDLQVTHTVSAKLMAGEEAEAIADALLLDQPDAQVEDHGSYLTIEAEGRLAFEMSSISESLGRPYDVSTFLVVLASYTGQVDVQDDRVVITEMLAS